MDSKKLIQQLQLKPHPEGGYYRETYRSEQETTTKEGHKRNLSTAIYYLLEGNDRSHFHRIQSDEMWFFHQGEPLELVLILNNAIHTVVLGHNLNDGEVPQAIIPANTWFAARIKSGEGYALMSCTVAPGFSFQDFELAEIATMEPNISHLKKYLDLFIS